MFHVETRRWRARPARRRGRPGRGPPPRRRSAAATSRSGPATTFTSRICTVPVRRRRSRRCGTRRAARAAGARPARRPPARRPPTASSRAGQWKCAAPGRVAGGVVVDPALRHDLHRRQRARRRRSSSTTVTATSTPATNCSASTVSRTRGSRPSRPAARRASRHHLRAQRRPALVRLEHQRQPEPVDHRVEHRLRAELPERGVRQRDPVRGVEARAGELGLGGRLVPRPAAGASPGADERHAEQLQHRLHRAVLALAAVQRDHDRVRRVGPQPLDSAASTSHSRTARPGIAQRGGQPAPGPQRHLALVGEAAGQHGHGAIGHSDSSNDQIVHCGQWKGVACGKRRTVRSPATPCGRRAGLPAVDAGTATAAVGPREAGSLTACSATVPAGHAGAGAGSAAERVQHVQLASSTAASRRTPSVIRSGVG